VINAEMSRGSNGTVISKFSKVTPICFFNIASLTDKTSYLETVDIQDRLLDDDRIYIPKMTMTCM